MISYKIEYSCSGYLTELYEIHVLFNDVKIGCIFYLEDSLKSSFPEVHFDKWSNYKQYENQMPNIDPFKIAQEIIMEHFLLQ